MSFELLINGERLISLAPGIYRIGRHPENEIHIEDPTLSRRHATLMLEEGICKIIDGDYLTGRLSANGLFINGEKLTPSQGTELSHGDEIKLSNNTNMKYFESNEVDEYDPETTLL